MTNAKNFSDFLEPDQRSQDILRDFFFWMKDPGGLGMEEAQASAYAFDADRYLRDFLVDIMEQPPEETDAENALRYLANWYIVNTLIPTHEEMARIAKALAHLHKFMGHKGLISAENAEKAQEAMSGGDFFRERLEAFWALTPEGIPAWRSIHEYRQTEGGDRILQ